MATRRERLDALRMRGHGLLDAKRILDREDMLAEIEAAQTIDDIKAILRKLVAN